MAVITTLEKIAVKMNLNNGTDPTTGEVKTVAVSLGSLSTTGYDAAKALAVASAIEGCLSKTIYSVSEVKTSTISEE